MGLGRFVRALASGPSQLITLPATSRSAGAEVVLDAEVDAIGPIVTEMMPFPLPSSPGARPTVRLLDGVGDQPLTLTAGRALVGAGAQITIVGNAPQFGHERTVVEYHTRSAEGDAAVLAVALGEATVAFEPTVAENETASVDITVIVGSDYRPEEDT